MVSYICGTHSEYPKRLPTNNLFYTEYKQLRPFFFHKKLLKKPSRSGETLVPTIEDFKDKFSYITNDHVLNSICFYCDYFIYYEEGEDILCHVTGESLWNWNWR